MNYEIALKIIEFLASNKDLINIAELSKKIKENSVTTQRTIKELKDKNIIRTKEIGKSHLVFLNKTSEVLGFLTLAKSMKLRDTNKVLEEANDIYNNIKIE